MKIGKSIAIVGGTGSGKTTYIKNALKKYPAAKKYIFDPNEEYTEFANEAADKFLFKDFKGFANKKAKGSIVVLEELTPHLRHGTNDEDILELLTRQRHKVNLNFFVWHSLRSVPVSVFDFVNYFVLMHTNDRNDIIKKKFEMNPLIYEAYQRQQTKPKFSKTIIKLK